MVNLSLKNKTALITGASRQKGIGMMVARLLAEAGANIFITHYRPYDVQTSGLAGHRDEVTQFLAELQALGYAAHDLALDLTTTSAPQTLFDAVIAQFGTVDILVNNATHSENDGWENLTLDLLDQHYAMNVRGMIGLCLEFTKRFKVNNQQYGRIINLTSGQGLGPMVNELAYATTKGAVDAFTMSYSAAVAPLKITVNAIDPGITDTGWISPELKQQFETQAPFGRVGIPLDAARLIRFLASDEAVWITGQIIRSRGGL